MTTRRGGARSRVIAAALLALALAAGCGGESAPDGAAPPPTAAATTAPIATQSATAASTPAEPEQAAPTTADAEAAQEAGETAATDPYDIRPERVTGGTLARIEGKSWKPEDDCPVPPKDLRLIHIPHWTFEKGETAVGEMIIHKDVVDDVEAIFAALYEAEYPIERMELIDRFRGADGAWADDFESIEANNTSAFNCRPVTGGTSFSKHSFGTAIDINPLQNPYVLDGRTSHPRSEPFLDRVRSGKGPEWRAMILPEDPIVAIFAERGWEWGGDWANPIDYQHFSKDGG